MPIIFLKTQNSFEKNNISRDNNLRTLLLAFIAIIFVAAITIPTPSMAVHKGAGNLVCGQCHTMHNSQGGTNLEGNSTGSILLLRGAVSSREEIHKLCLQCHAENGAQAYETHMPHNELAPKVYGANWNQSKTFGEIGAGGDFVNEINGYPSFNPTAAGDVNALGFGHSVGKSNAIPPGNPNNPSVALTCTTCHNPHGTSTQGYGFNGTNLFRNLWVGGPTDRNTTCLLCHPDSGGLVTPFNPGELWEMKSWVGGITGVFGVGNYTPAFAGLVAIWPAYNPSGDFALAVNHNVYDGYYGVDERCNEPNAGNGDCRDGGVGEWCARCHPKFHEGSEAGNDAGQGDWFRHPVTKVLDKQEVSGANVPTVDWNHYNLDISNGKKLPAANNNDTVTTEFYYADDVADGGVGTGDRVFCLSCHFAHAGPYYDALRWEYLTEVGAGTQSDRNGVPSDRGCQQCHNR